MRQRSASAPASSSLKPRRTSSQAVRRVHAVEVFMMRRACGSSGSSSVCGILALSASESRTGTSCSPRRKLWMARAPRRPAAIGLDGRAGAHRGRVAAGEHAGAAGHHRVGVHLRSGRARRRRCRRLRGSRRRSPGRRRRSPCRPRTRESRPSTTGPGRRQPRSLGSPRVQRWNLTPVATPSFPRISTGTSRVLDVRPAPPCPPRSPRDRPARCARPRCRPG